MKRQSSPQARRRGSVTLAELDAFAGDVPVVYWATESPYGVQTGWFNFDDTLELEFDPRNPARFALTLDKGLRTESRLSSGGSSLTAQSSQKSRRVPSVALENHVEMPLSPQWRQRKLAEAVKQFANNLVKRHNATMKKRTKRVVAKAPIARPRSEAPPVLTGAPPVLLTGAPQKMAKEPVVTIFYDQHRKTKVKK